MLVGIAQRESGLDPLTLHDNASGEVLRGAGVIEAARRLIAAGHSVDLGAWQINSRNLSLLGLGIADAFEPCKSAAAAARLIELFSRYNTGSPTPRDRERLRALGSDRHSRSQGRERDAAANPCTRSIIDVCTLSVRQAVADRPGSRLRNRREVGPCPGSQLSSQFRPLSPARSERRW